jgi:hypothetical protein
MYNWFYQKTQKEGVDSYGNDQYTGNPAKGQAKSYLFKLWWSTWNKKHLGLEELLDNVGIKKRSGAHVQDLTFLYVSKPLVDAS